MSPSMNFNSKRRCQTILVVTRAALLIFPNGVTWYWGNMSVLTLSYVVSCVTSEVHTPWVISLYIIFRSLGLIMYDLSRKICGKKCILIIGIIISDAALFVCYWVVQHSLVLLDIALGVCVGFGSGLLFGDALKSVVERADNNVGLMTSIIQGSFAAGAMVINEFVTLYSNPHNLSPDLQVGHSLYFSQKDIIDKIPFMFLYIGCFSLTLHITAFILLKQECLTCISDPSDKETEGQTSEIDTNTGHSHRPEPILDENTSLPCASPASEDNQTGLSPKEMLRTASFYTLWFAFFIGDFPILLLINYYKIFGQIWIHDDHFLTDLGSAVVFINAWIRFGWGIIIDKLGVKNSLIIILSPAIILNIWYYFTAMNNRWIYLFSTFLFGSLSGALYGIFPAVMVLMYGKSHFSTNFGILSSATIVFNIVGPPMIEAILKHFGWFVLFASSAILNSSSLFLLLKFVP